MTDTSATKPESIFASPAARITLVMSALFCGNGVLMPFLPRWLEVERGLTGVEIGAVLSIAQLTRIVVGPSLAAWADGFADRRVPFRVFASAALLSYALFFFAAHNFLLLLLFGFAATTLAQAMAPLIEAAAMRAAANGRLSFGVSRAIGSIAFILGNVGSGALVGAVGLGVVPAWTTVTVTIVAAASWFWLAPEAPTRVTAGFRKRLRTGWDFARQRRIALLLIGCGCIQASHAYYYGFSTLLWRGQGVSAETVGFLWAFGVAVEVTFLFFLTRIEARVRPELLILSGAIGGLVRWSSLALAPPEILLWPLQALHTLTFCAAHVGALRILIREAPEEVAGLAPTFYAALHGGLFMGIATLIGGYLYDHVGVAGYFVMTALSALGLMLVLPLANEKRA